MRTSRPVFRRPAGRPPGRVGRRLAEAEVPARGWGRVERESAAGPARHQGALAQPDGGVLLSSPFEVPGSGHAESRCGPVPAGVRVCSACLAARSLQDPEGFSCLCAPRLRGERLFLCLWPPKWREGRAYCQHAGKPPRGGAWGEWARSQQGVAGSTGGHERGSWPGGWHSRNRGRLPAGPGKGQPSGRRHQPGAPVVTALRACCCARCLHYRMGER
jgi:hypothetical protein